MQSKGLQSRRSGMLYLEAGDIGSSEMCIVKALERPAYRQIAKWYQDCQSCSVRFVDVDSWWHPVSGWWMYPEVGLLIWRHHTCLLMERLRGRCHFKVEASKFCLVASSSGEQTSLKGEVESCSTTGQLTDEFGSDALYCTMNCLDQLRTLYKFVYKNVSESKMVKYWSPHKIGILYLC